MAARGPSTTWTQVRIPLVAWALSKVDTMSTDPLKLTAVLKGGKFGRLDPTTTGPLLEVSPDSDQ